MDILNYSLLGLVDRPNVKLSDTSTLSGRRPPETISDLSARLQRTLQHGLHQRVPTYWPAMARPLEYHPGTVEERSLCGGRERAACDGDYTGPDTEDQVGEYWALGIAHRFVGISGRHV